MYQCFFLSVGLATSLFGCSISVAAPTEPEHIKEVVSLKVKVEDISEFLTYPARVESKINAPLLADFDGVVRAIRVGLGSTVRQGEKLMTLEHTDPAYQYAPVTLRASRSGQVSQIEVTAGGRISKGQKLLVLTDPQDVRVVIEVPTGDLHSLKVGGLAAFIPGNARDDVPMKLVGLSPVVDSSTGTATGNLEPSGKPQALKLQPGMLGQIRFQVNQRKGMTLPEHAIVYRGGEVFVRVIRTDRAHQVKVKLGGTRQGRVEILEGVREGDVVIERASGFIADGEQVKTSNSEGIPGG